MSCTAIIQARLGSERFPLKVLQQIPPESGVSMLEMVVKKVCLATKVDEVVVTTPDRMIAVLCNRWQIPACAWAFKERDVLREYYETARTRNLHFDPEAIIVRVTADCPLISPEIIDYMVKDFLNDPVDITFNTDESTSQLAGEGSDVEVFSYAALEKAHKEAKGEEREHPTLWMRRNLKTRHFYCSELGIRSVNTPEDYAFVCKRVREGDKINSDNFSKII